MLQVHLAEQRPQQSQHPRHARALRGDGLCLQLLAKVPRSSPFNNPRDGLTEAERRGRECSWVQHLCAHSARPGNVSSMIEYPLHSPRGKYLSHCQEMRLGGVSTTVTDMDPGVGRPGLVSWLLHL